MRVETFEDRICVVLEDADPHPWGVRTRRECRSDDTALSLQGRGRNSGLRPDALLHQAVAVRIRHPNVLDRGERAESDSPISAI